MRNTLRMLLVLTGMLAPLTAQAAPPANNAANQKQKPNPNQKQNPPPNQKQQQNQNLQQNQNAPQQNQNGGNTTAQAIQYSVQQLMTLDKNQSGGVEVNEVVNNQVLTLCQNADADKNGTVTATEFTAALTSVATTVNTAGGNSTTAVLTAAGCGQGNNQTGATGTGTNTTARTGQQATVQNTQQQGAGLQGQGMGPGMMRGGPGGGQGGGMQRGPGGGAPPRR
jgi:hypothetical protein